LHWTATHQNHVCGIICKSNETQSQWQTVVPYSRQVYCAMATTQGQVSREPVSQAVSITFQSLKGVMQVDYKSPDRFKLERRKKQ
jgi:hypothetical protein